MSVADSPKMLERASVDQFRILIAGVSGVFQTKSGGQPTADSWTDFDGGDDVPYVGVHKPTYSDLTIGRTFAPVRDRPLVKTWSDPRLRGTSTTVSVYPLGVNNLALVDPIIYVVKFKTCNDPDVDSNGRDKAQFQMIYAVVSRS